MKARAADLPQLASVLAEASTPRLYRVPEAMRLLSLSRSVLYDQIRSGRLKSVTQGRSRRIPASAIADYIALLEREAGDDQPA